MSFKRLTKLKARTFGERFLYLEKKPFFDSCITVQEKFVCRRTRTNTDEIRFLKKAQIIFGFYAETILAVAETFEECAANFKECAEILEETAETFEACAKILEETAESLEACAETFEEHSATFEACAGRFEACAESLEETAETFEETAGNISAKAGKSLKALF